MNIYGSLRNINHSTQAKSFYEIKLRLTISNLRRNQNILMETKLLTYISIWRYAYPPRSFFFFTVIFRIYVTIVATPYVLSKSKLPLIQFKPDW